MESRYEIYSRTESDFIFTLHPSGCCLGSVILHPAVRVRNLYAKVVIYRIDFLGGRVLKGLLNLGEGLQEIRTIRPMTRKVAIDFIFFYCLPLEFQDYEDLKSR